MLDDGARGDRDAKRSLAAGDGERDVLSLDRADPSSSEGSSETPSAPDKSGEPTSLKGEAPRRRDGDEKKDDAETNDEKADAKSGQEDDENKDEGPGLLRRHPLAFAIGAIAVVVLGVLGLLYWMIYVHPYENTDDAFVDARSFSVAPKVNGYLVAVPVTDNQHVGTGEILFQIDQRDYVTAIDQAKAQGEAAQAQIESAKAQIEAQKATIEQAQAQVQSAQAALNFARQDAARYQDLAQKGAGSIQQSQQSTSTERQQQANLAAANASVSAAQKQIGSLRAQQANAEATLAQAKAQQEQAELNLSYTTIRAAQPGRVVRLTGAVGQYAQVGQSVSMFVPDDIWVTANFKETQITDMRPGQPVRIEIDAYPERRITGHVASVQPGSGTAFSLLPAQNATGNYIKVVQRIPVKIVADNWPTDVSIGPGMSIVPTVTVRDEPRFYERWFGKPNEPDQRFRKNDTP